MIENKKLYSQKAIGIATFFGGPMAAGYLVKKNYESFGQESHAKKAFFIGIISTLLLFAGVFSIPEHIIDKIPNAIIPAIYTGIIYLIVEKLQGQNLKEHLESGNLFHSTWKAVGIGIVNMIIILLIIAITAFIAGDLSNVETKPSKTPDKFLSDSFFDDEKASSDSKKYELSFRENLKDDEIGIKYPKKVKVGDKVVIELINTKEGISKVEMLQSDNYSTKGMGSSSSVTYVNGVMSGTYKRKFSLTFNKEGEYTIDKNCFENLPQNLSLRSETIKVE